MLIGKERRKFVRLNAHHQIKYTVMKKKIQDLRPFVRDISAGGVLFYTEEHIPKDSIIEVEINIPSRPQPLKAKCRVARVNPLKKVGGFEIGVEFLDAGKDIQDFISRRVLETHKKIRGGDPVRKIAMIVLVLAGVSALIGLYLKLSAGLVLPTRPIVWLYVTNTCLLFSIALSFLVAQK